jgi:hypothetical protein
MNISREPALILALLASVVQMVSAFVWPLTIDQQGVINAAAAAVAGLVVAILVHSEQLVPAIVGMIQAALALGLAFGFHLAGNNQAVIMAFIVSVGAMFVRTQVYVLTPPAHLAQHALA